MPICRVKGCKSTRRNPTVTLHQFPKDRSVRDAWLRFCGCTEEKNLFVCSLHFRATDYENIFMKNARKRLQKHAVPSIRKLLDESDRGNRASIRNRKKLVADLLEEDKIRCQEAAKYQVLLDVVFEPMNTYDWLPTFEEASVTNQGTDQKQSADLLEDGELRCQGAAHHQMASQQTEDSKHDVQLPATIVVKEEPPSSLDDLQSPPIYHETVVTKEELILTDQEEEPEEDCQPDTSGETFSCKKCQKSFENQSFLGAHQLIHTNMKHKTFMDVEALDRDGVIKCVECGMTFKTYNVARNHFIKHANLKEGRYVCNLCDARFGANHSLQNHIAAHENTLKTRKKPDLMKYKCDQCGKAYDVRHTYRAHLRKHKNINEANFKCEHCSKVFGTRGALKNHQLTVHKTLSSICQNACEESPDRPLYCGKCDILFDSKTAFSAHLRWVQTKDERLRKPLVSDTEDSTSAVVKLEPMEVEEDSSSNSCDTSRLSLQCKTCHERFDTEEALRKHAKTHKLYVNKSGMLVLLDNRVYKCTECDKTFNSKPAATVHVRRHLTRLKGLYQCKICNLRSSGASSLKMHMKIHENKGQKAATTKDDKGVFEMTSKQSITEVQQSVVVKQEPQASEEKSSFSFEVAAMDEPTTSGSVAPPEQEGGSVILNESVMKEELIIEDINEEPSFVQELETVVKEEFIITEVLEDQQEPVQTLGEFACTRCERKFSKEDMLTDHMRIHANMEMERYKCNVCGECFSGSTDLDLHRQRHKKEPRYECATCHEKFHTPIDLAKHERIHAMDPVYVQLLDNLPQNASGNWPCIMCDVVYPTRRQTYWHVKGHINKLEGNFECTICGLRNGNKGSHKVHLKTHFNDAGEPAIEPDDGDLPNPDVACQKGGPLHCKTCDKFFISVIAMHVHLQKSELRLLKLKLSKSGITVPERNQIKQDKSYQAMII